MIKQILICVVLTFCSLQGQASAQVGHETDLWRWGEVKDYHSSIVRVTCWAEADFNKDGILDDNNNDGVPDLFPAGGTGTVVYVDKSKEINSATNKGYYGYILTANHVVQPDPNGPIKNIKSIDIDYVNGKKSRNCSVKDKDSDHDIVLIWAWVPAEINAVKIADSEAFWKDELEFVGLGGDTSIDKPRVFLGMADRPSTDQIIFSADSYFIPGDSGGPGFVEGGLVCVISGGCVWWDGGVKTFEGKDIKPTYPGRAYQLRPIRNLLHKVFPDKFNILPVR